MFQTSSTGNLGNPLYFSFKKGTKSLTSFTAILHVNFKYKNVSVKGELKLNFNPPPPTPPWGGGAKSKNKLPWSVKIRTKSKVVHNGKTSFEDCKRYISPDFTGNGESIN